MQKNLKQVLSFVLALVMMLGILPVTALAEETQVASSDLPTVMDGLTIAYPYNTENVQRTGTVPNRFSALTFESARNEVESAQMILTPNFKVDSFELTMSSMTNAKGNVIPSWAFEVYVQQYATVTGSGNSPKFGDFKTQDSWFLSTKYLKDVFHPRSGNKAWDGTYPDALIPQDAAIANGLNTISANQNQGIWVNLNVQNAAPGTYNGTATLTINGNAMQIPVSVRIYDVAIPDEVHMTTAFGIWWDMMYAGEGINANDSNVREDMITNYYNYVVSKRITPWDRGVNQWRYTDMLVEYAVANATDPSISSYRLYFSNDASNAKRVDRASVVTCLTALINKNIELVNAGNNVDLFKKAYYYFSNVDEPAGGSKAASYADVQACIDTLDSVKAELAPLLASYPNLQASFLALKNVVTGPDPVNYKNTWYIDGCPDYSKQSSLTSTYDSVVYCPQFNYLQTADMRNTYADDSEIWWYGCCHPVAPYPTYHLNTPLANTRAVGFMMYEYEIDGMLSSSVNLWGTYNDDGSINLPSNYTTISGNGTPGDMILLYPGADYGVEGPVGTLRIESIRESSEDYEYLWMLENIYGISDISAYTAGLYEGAIVTGVYDGHTVDPDGDGNTDASDLYHNRRIALLTKLEQLSVAKNGATNITPGNEGFVRGDRFTAGKDTYFYLDEPGAWGSISFEYKIEGTGELAAILRGTTWTTYYGDFRLNATGEKLDYPGVTTEILDDGYIRVTFDIAKLNRSGCIDNRNNAPVDIKLIDIFGAWTTAEGYIDNIQYQPHVHSYESVVTEPTPYAQGYTTHTCSCGDSYVDSYTEYEVPGAVVLTEDASVNWTLNQDLYIDLNGHNLTGQIATNGFKIYGMDSATNAYSADNMGIFSCVDAEGKAIVPQQFCDTEAAKYMTISADRGYSFHRYYLGITMVSLDPSVTGFGYKAEFRGDAMVQTQVKSVGYALWLTEDVVLKRDAAFKASLTLRLKNFDVENYGNAPVNAMATMTLVDGTVLEGQVHSWSMQQMVETVNATATNYSAQQIIAVKTMVEANITMLNWQVENILRGVIRGKAFTAGKDNYFYVEAGNWDTVSFEYKIEGAGEVVVVLRGSAWGAKYYGDYRFVDSGEKVDYAGVTAEKLADGYIRVSFDVATLGRTGCVDNLNSEPADIALIDIFNWTTANGYIDNIQVSKEEKEEVIRGTQFTGGVDKFMYLDKNATKTVTFEYRLTTAGDIHVILRAPDWNGFYGDFEFNANGEAVDYDGITTEKLADGYIRVTMTLAELNRTGCVNNRDSAPASVGIFDLYQWGTASGYVDNIQLDP